MLNKVLLIGRVSSEPEIRFLPSGMQVTSFSVAHNRAYKSGESWKEEVYYFDVDSFSALAERLGKQLNKGMQIVIEGSLKQERWETEDGSKRSRVKIVAEKVSILSKPKSEGKQQEEKEEEDVPF